MVSSTLKDIHNSEDYLPSLVKAIIAQDQKDAGLGKQRPRQMLELGGTNPIRKRCGLTT